jgi:thiol-disulfide isomerase/thioredoxin
MRWACLALVGLSLAGGARAAPTPPNLNLEPYKGRVVYLDFWASWCGPCKLSFPYMQKMVSHYPASDFVVLTVNVDRDPQKAAAFLQQVGAHLPVVYDASGAVATRFGVKAMPSSVLIGRDGRVRYVHQGFFPGKTATYEAHITELIDEGK